MQMKFLVEFLIVSIGMILRHLLASLSRAQIALLEDCFPNSLRLSLNGRNYLGSILVLLYIGVSQPDGLSSIGMSFGRWPLALIVAAPISAYLRSVFVMIRFRSREIQ